MSNEAMAYSKSSSYGRTSVYDRPVACDMSDDSLTYDGSSLKTIENIVKHKKSVGNALRALADELYKRADSHDDSKLQMPELGMLINMDKSKRPVYGSPEYYEHIKKNQAFFDHHYRGNSHHPEHYKNGVHDMDLVDVIEMIADWCSYSKNLSIQEICNLIEQQSKRFGFGEEVADIFKNTMFNYFSWLIHFE